MVKELFGILPQGQEVYRYAISSEQLSASILDYGAIIQDLRFDKASMVLSYDNLEAYLNDEAYLGAAVGRNGGRISEGMLIIDGNAYPLAQNNGSCNLHGGERGFNSVLWQVKEHRKESITLAYHSPDGEEGFPGAVDLELCYRIEGASFHLDYKAQSDSKTLLNPTQHSYFNLSRRPCDVLRHELRLDADYFAALGDDFAPESRQPVQGTPFDFRRPKAIGWEIGRPHPQLEQAGGYDHPFFLSQNKPQIMVRCPESGIALNISTDRSAVVFYTGNFLKNPFIHRQGMCFETQECSNGTFHPSLGQPFIDPTHPYEQHTSWEFFKF